MGGTIFFAYTIQKGQTIFKNKNHSRLDFNTHVQYTQTDTIRQTDGPLLPMVRLVPIENDVIPMVPLVNKARSKYKHAMCILRSISHLCKISSLLHQEKTR